MGGGGGLTDLCSFVQIGCHLLVVLGPDLNVLCVRREGGRREERKEREGGGGRRRMEEREVKGKG